MMNSPLTQRHNVHAAATAAHDVDDDDHHLYNRDDNDDDAVSSSLLVATANTHGTTSRRILVQALPLLLLFLGLTIFTQSFFLSRTAVDARSSCELQSAGNLLISALGFDNGKEDVEYLRQMGWLSDGDNGSSAIDTNNNNIIGLDKSTNSNTNYGCWVPRRVDSMAILVVDALRFDFARDHLPLSVGSRLFTNTVEDSTTSNDGSKKTKTKKKGLSKLYRFVADPPTVTMQRLKGLTTGGLPTFADITGSFGGASIHEDSWVEQLKDAPWDRRKKRRRQLVHYQSSQNSLVDNESDVKRGGDDVRLLLHDEKRPQLAFVGDDTWFDLFPTQFDDCHPFPSFNTRDLDTVDNGCLLHLPRLLDGLVGLKTEFMDDTTNLTTTMPSYELIVAHFLGVDHVGHTYGPNNPHMERKLHQMDVMLSDTLDAIDEAPSESCIVALILGDHGMTEDGNHGGGTSDEINAGLFVHFSPGCHEGELEKAGVNGDELGAHSARVFDAIHQIDLVPTISFLMGIPIPYANIGSLVPDLLPPPPRSNHHASMKKSSLSSSTPHIATALALNAAQVWNYLYTYSKRSRDLPKDKMRELKEMLDSASLMYRAAISQSKQHAKANHESTDEEKAEDIYDSTAYRQASVLFKLFLAESTDLGRQVWTQFNEGGMKIGIGILIAAWIMTIPLWRGSVRVDLAREIFSPIPRNGGRIKENVKGNQDGTMFFRRMELVTASTLMIFYCGVLTFGNSYIDHEREIITFFLSVLCLLVFCRWYFTASSSAHSSFSSVGSNSAYLPLVVALCSRANDLVVTGHGMDPSIRLHAAHLPVVFVSSLFALMILRIKWLGPSASSSTILGRIGSASMEIIAVVCIAFSWWDKRANDHSRTGFLTARIAMMIVLLGIFQSTHSLYKKWKLSIQYGLNDIGGVSNVENFQVLLFRVTLFLVIVTGPSAASSAVLIVIQCATLRLLTDASGTRELAAPTLAALWRLAIRHAFFATNHHCSFNHLQFSAAFVATNIFQFHIAGMSLFMNTFGWEIVGSCLLLVYSRSSRTNNSIWRESSSQYRIISDVWDWFLFFQWTEILASCLSVRLMKRHLMVWAIFAPRFMFAAVFSVLASVFGAVNVLAVEVEQIIASSASTTNAQSLHI